MNAYHLYSIILFETPWSVLTCKLLQVYFCIYIRPILIFIYVTDGDGDKIFLKTEIVRLAYLTGNFGF